MISTLSFFVSFYLFWNWSLQEILDETLIDDNDIVTSGEGRFEGVVDGAKQIPYGSIQA